MASLFSQNIGLNYKGILNLNTLNGNLTSTLQAVTDGDGNASPLQLSTTNVAMVADTFFGASSATTNILTLQSTTRNQLKVESGSTLEFWRSAGVESARFDANGNFLISATSATARLHVRGDGTNPVQRWENGAGTDLAAFTNAGLLSFFGIGQGIDFYGQGVKFLDSIGTIDYSNAGGSVSAYHRFRSPSSPTTGNQKVIGIESNFGAAAGNATFRPLSLEYTINNSGAQTGTATGIFLNATETALDGMTHNLIDLQVGGVSQFRVSRIGDTTSNGTFVSLNSYTNFIGNRFQLSTGLASNRTLFVAVGEGIMRISDATENAFNRINLGGNTNAFPAIKRNGSAIDFRLADDSALCAVNAASFSTTSVNVGSNFIAISGDSGLLRPAASTLAISLNGFSNNHFEFRKNSDATVVGIIKGTGSPEGVITANAGSIFLRTDGGVLSTFYVKQSGTGNTGWAAIA
jgi:hypothetical protein